MELLLATITLVFISVALIAYTVSRRKAEKVHLPADIIKENAASEPKKFSPKGILSAFGRGAERFIESSNMPLDNLKRKLAAAAKPMSASQFLVFKLFTTIILPLAVFVMLKPAPTALLALAVGVGFLLPDIWLNIRIKNRRAAILKDLPHVIDLLNICVGAGLDFMVAVNRVIKEFRPCPLIEEMKLMTNEIQMGGSRKEALLNLSGRISAPEISSFVRTLVQADRIGSPITKALKIHAEEIRLQWFQRGEEQALKAPIKLLAPLLIFILPVVLIIVAGPILIRFTRGGMIKF